MGYKVTDQSTIYVKCLRTPILSNTAPLLHANYMNHRGFEIYSKRAFFLAPGRSFQLKRFRNDIRSNRHIHFQQVLKMRAEVQFRQSCQQPNYPHSEGTTNQIQYKNSYLVNYEIASKRGCIKSVLIQPPDIIQSKHVLDQLTPIAVQKKYC